MNTHIHNHRATGPLHRVNEWLEHLSRFVSAWAGSSWAFGVALFVIIVWGVTGPIFQFSDTWQLVINTGTTIVTFLMVFLIQRSQNKDALAIQIKLDELLASQQGASNWLINVEDWSEEDIAALHERFTKLAERLEQVADDNNSHSIAEAKEAAEQVDESLENARRARERHAKL